LVTTNVTIEEEKVLFGKLNDRLATYIEVSSIPFAREPSLPYFPLPAGPQFSPFF
jgi:hypothetical protein